jgi:hypothetical protein
MTARAVFLTLLVACGSNEPSREHATLASLHFDVPSEWQRTDSNQRGVQQSEWKPADNDRKETITIIRSERSPAVAKAEVATLEQLLAIAQRSLRGIRASKPKPIATSHGMAGARIDVEFLPTSAADRYHRVHVVLADKGGALVHVMYTARTPDPELRALSIVLDTLRHEES